MHFASASFRIVTAGFKLAEGRLAVRKSFVVTEAGEWFNTWANGKPKDWNRDTAEKLFSCVRRTARECCQLVSVENRLSKEHSIVILLLHRDEFGHSEQPPRHKNALSWPYRKRRKRTLEAIPMCRILEAQRVIGAWVLDWLEKR
jgi:hypothetical protein